MAYFTSEDKNGVSVVRFCFEEIDLEQRDEIKNELRKLLDGRKNFVFNFSKIGFFSSLVIATIISFAREARTKGGDVRLCALSHDARTMVQITNLDHVFEIFADEQAAVDSYKA